RGCCLRRNQSSGFSRRHSGAAPGTGSPAWAGFINSLACDFGNLSRKVGMELRVIRRALLSVYDKTGLIELARALSAFEVELISTGGTRKALEQAGLKVRDIAEVTESPEILDGRVKTLHPKIHGGILAIRDNAEHTATLRAQGITPIDLVVCNLYPFEATL